MILKVPGSGCRLDHADGAGGWWEVMYTYEAFSIQFILISQIYA